MKKVLSLVLVIAMVLSSMSFAFAGTFEDVTGDYEDAVDALSSLGVINGYEDGTFKPENTLKRAELAKLLVEALGYGNLVEGAAGTFSDTKGHWAEGYIAVAAGTGLVNGYPDGTFQPEKTLTYDEVFAMVIRGLGYTDETVKGTWPTNYKVKAIDLGLDDDVVLGVGADRGGVAQVLYNALELPLVETNADGYAEKVDPEKLLIDNIATLEEYYYVNPDKLDKDDNDYAGDKVDLTPYVYQYLDVYTNDDDEVVYVKDNNSETLSGTVDSVDEGKGQIVVEDAEDDKYTINTTGNSITVYYNGEQTTIDADEFNELLYRGNDDSEKYNALEAKITVISGDSLETIKADDSEEIESGDSADHFIVERASQGILVDTDYVTGKTKISGVDGSISLPKDSSNDVDLEEIAVTGAVDSLEDIVEDDVVIAYEAVSADSVKLVVVRDTVEGKVTKTADDQTTVYVDGTEYTLSRISNSVRYDSRPEVGDEGVFYLDDAGKIFAVDTDGAALSDYAYVISTADGEYSDKMDGSVEDYPQLKLLTQDGETTVYDVLVTIDENALDDYATYTDESTSPEAIDAELVELLDDANKTIDLTVSLKDKLVKYSVDSDGYIDEIEIMETQGITIDTDDIEDIAASNAIVFDIENNEVVSLDNLNDGDHFVLYDDGEIVVFVTTNVDSANDDVYGIISEVALTTNDDGDDVTEITAFVNGEEVTYLAEDDSDYEVADEAITTGTAVQFDFNTNEEVEGTDTIDNAKYSEDVDVYNSYIKVGGTQYTFAKDVAVYIYDESDEEWLIGDVSDLDDDEPTAVFNTSDTDGIANIVVQTQP